MSDLLTVPETPERAEEILEQLEPGETMLEVRVVGSSSLADGLTDELRSFEDRDRFQVQPGMGGCPHWVTKEEAIPDLVGKPMEVVEWRDRV